MRIISWNVNGIRALIKKGLAHIIEQEKPDLFCVQETKAHPNQVELPHPLNKWNNVWASAEKAGYSGVAIFSPHNFEMHSGCGISRFDSEGRVTKAKKGNLVIYNCYFPNGGQGSHRVAFKLDFYNVIQDIAYKDLLRGNEVIVIGDFNTAPYPIDLARPEENKSTSGFLPEERAEVYRWYENGWIDAFRFFHKEVPEKYTWWDLKTRARERNIGWRIDYPLVSSSLKKKLQACEIRADIMGSDHAPVVLDLVDAL